MAVRVRLGNFVRELDPNQTYTVNSLMQSSDVPWSNWLVGEDGQEYSGDDFLPPGDYRVVKQVWGTSELAAKQRLEILRNVLNLPGPVVDLIHSYLPNANQAEVVKANKFGCCCCCKVARTPDSVYQKDQLGFPLCCVDPYSDDNKGPKWLFYLGSRLLVFGPLLSLTYSAIWLGMGTSGKCCVDFTPSDWATRFIPCWVMYILMYVLYWRFAMAEAEYLQGDYDEGTGQEGCYVSITMVTCYMGACIGLNAGLCYVV